VYLYNPPLYRVGHVLRHPPIAVLSMGCAEYACVSETPLPSIVKNTSLSSVYDRPAVQQQLAQQRASLKARGITPYRFIGAAYVPKEFHTIQAGQDWLEWVFLR
jgi:hypothetical protein